MIGRIIAKGSPNIPLVINILSTPVCGVEIKNDKEEPLDAPLLYIDDDTGITPQEHKGIGTPKIDAFNIEINPGRPR